MNREQLIAAGFQPTMYEGQEGEFLVKSVKVEAMPYAREHLIDNEMIFGDMQASTEVTPDGRVQLVIADADYVEGPIALETEEGRALLGDALEAQ